MTDWAELLEKSLALAIEAHRGQRQKNGQPYILHPLHLMMQQSEPAAQITALLHDIVEDSEVTFDNLIALGLPDEIIEALKLLTHDPALPYREYIRQIKRNQLATQVKLTNKNLGYYQ